MWCQAPITESLPRCVPLNCQDKSHPPTLQMMKQRLWEGRGLAWLPPKGLKLEPEHNPRFAGAKFCDTAFLLKPGRFQQTKKFEKHWIEPSLKKIPYGRACQNFNKLIDWIFKRRVLYFSNLLRASLVAQLVKNPLAMWEPWVWSLGQEDPLKKGKATHSSILAWRIPWNTVHGIAKNQTWLSDFHRPYNLSISIIVSHLYPKDIWMRNKYTWNWKYIY